MKKCANIGEAVIAANQFLVRLGNPSEKESTGVARKFILFLSWKGRMKQQQKLGLDLGESLVLNILHPIEAVDKI